MKNIKYLHVIYYVMWILFVCSLSTVTMATTPVNLGSVSSFAALASSGITVTGGGDIFGDVGVSPGSAFTPGNPPVTVHGNIYLADSAAALAQVSLTTAYNDAAGRIGANTVGTELGGTTPPPGVYTSAAGTFGITGTLTLDALGDSSAVWIFQAASTLITADGSQVILAGGAKVSNIFWQVGSSATLGKNSNFKGTILAQVSITSNTGAVLTGRALARTGAVTLDDPYSTISSTGTPPIFANPPHLKIFIGYGLDSAFNLEDFNSGGRGSSYSIPTDFLSLGTTDGSFESQALYTSATTGTNTYQITNDIGTSSANGKVKYSTYKIYKLPKVGLTAGTSWDVNVASYTYDSSGNAVPPSFGMGSALTVSDPSKVSAVWLGSTVIRLTSLQSFTGVINVDVIASPVATPPFGSDIDKERIYVYNNLLSNGTFSTANDTTFWSPLELAPGRSTLATQSWQSTFTDSAGTQANGVWKFSFADVNGGVKSTPSVSNWITMTNAQWYTFRMRLVTDNDNGDQSLLFGYNNYVGTGLQTDIAANVLFGIPTTWTWQETPLLVHGTTTSGYPQFQFKASTSSNIYIDEIQIINAAPTLVDANRYLTRIKYAYGAFDASSDTAGWGQQIYYGAGSAPGISVTSSALYLNFAGAGSGSNQEGIKWTANNLGANAATFAATPGREVGVRATVIKQSGNFNSLGIVLVAAYGVQTSGQQTIGQTPSNLFAAAGVGIIPGGTYRTVAKAVNPYYQFQFGLRSDQSGIMTISDVDFDRDQDDPNFGDGSLFP